MDDHWSYAKRAYCCIKEKKGCAGRKVCWGETCGFPRILRAFFWVRICDSIWYQVTIPHAHFDCAEDYGDWQSKWTDESWRQILHFTRLVFTSTCWTHVSPGSRNPQNRWGQESLVLRHSCASACWWFCLWKGGMCHICTSMILFSKWWSRSSLFDQPSNGIQWPKRSNMSK